MSVLLNIEALSVSLPIEGSQQRVLRDVSLTIAEGEAVGLVGESGSGKSMTARAAARLLPDGAEVSGRVEFDGKDVLGLGGNALRDYRRHVAVVFQDPRAYVNPVHRIGDFMTETLRLGGMKAAEATELAIAALSDVGVSDGERCLRQFPHELSGGRLQRVMIATMLLSKPKLLLADEPTTALDVTNQAEVMAILDELRRDMGMALLFITHDLELADAVCDRTAVMYAGSVLETAPSSTLRSRPAHPYTAALMRARPSLTETRERLDAIPGRPVAAFEATFGCPFEARCEYAVAECTAGFPPVQTIETSQTRCIRAQDVRSKLVGEPVRA